MSRFPTVPALDPAARLPALLAVVLLLGLIAQLWLGRGGVALPEVVGVARVARAGVPAVAPVMVPDVLGERALFVPPSTAAAGGGSDAGAAGPPPLGGARVAGALARGGRRVALLLSPTGRVSYVAPGGSVAGWRLEAIDGNAARFRRDGRVITMTFGAAAPVPPPGEDSDGDGAVDEEGETQ